MAILGAHFAPGGDALRPAQNERIAGAAPVGLALPAAEGGVAGVGPAPGVVVEVLRPTDVIDGGEVLREVFRNIVEELALVHRSGGTAFGAGSVVGDHHDHGVVVLTDLLQEVDKFSDVVVGVLQEAGEHLHHAGIEALLLGRQAVPVGHIGVVARKHGALRDDAQFLLAREGVLAVGVPAAIEFALVLVGPLLRHVVGRMHGAGAEVHEEGLIRRHLL